MGYLFVYRKDGRVKIHHYGDFFDSQFPQS
jgi:hypothetical protein